MTNNSKDSQVKIKPIKLIVKKPTSAKKEKKKNDNTQEIKKIIREQQIIDLFSSLKIILIIILLSFIITLIINIAKEQKVNPPKESNNNIIKNENGLLSVWRTPSGYSFSFEENKIFHIYESGLYVHNNYYEGTYEYLNGSAAIEEMGYNEEEFQNEFNIGTYQNVYSIHMKPTAYMKNETNIINRKFTSGNEWWFILIEIDNNAAIAYNKTLDIRYQLFRN